MMKRNACSSCFLSGSKSVLYTTVFNVTFRSQILMSAGLS